MNRQALYVRVSTEAQVEEGFSIEAQRQRLEAYCVAMGWENYDFFIDGGISGSHLDRPAMKELILAAKSQKISSVVVYKLDRLSRSQKDTLYLIEDIFLPNNVDFISLNENIDTSSPYGRAMIGILSAFAQLERENIFLRTRMGMLERVKQGYWMGGGGTPYGYNYHKDKGILVPNPKEAMVVAQVYDLYIKGLSPQKIATRLGLSYDRLVMQIINRRSNLGLIPYKGKEYRGKHEAIISQEIFDLAQNKRHSRQVGARAGGQHLLSGLIFCASCGSRMRYVKWGKKGYKLRCYSRDPSKNYMQKDELCLAPAVWAEDVETLVITDLKGISLDLRGAKKEFLSPIVTIQEQIQHHERKLKRFYHLYAEGEENTLLSLIEECRVNINKLKESLIEEEAIQQKGKLLAGLHEKICTIGEGWAFLSFVEQREIFRDCIEKIEIHGENISIRYHFITV